MEQYFTHLDFPEIAGVPFPFQTSLPFKGKSGPVWGTYMANLNGADRITTEPS